MVVTIWDNLPVLWQPHVRFHPNQSPNLHPSTHRKQKKSYLVTSRKNFLVPRSPSHALAVLLRRPAGGGGARVRLHGAFGRTRERQLLFRPLGCSTSCGRPRPEWPRAAERGRPTPRSLRLSASVEDQVGERRRRAVGLIIASSAPSLQPAFNITLPWPWLNAQPRKRVS